jgi:hypothetical protein
MPVYKLILPVISFSPRGTLPSLRRPQMGVTVESCETERHAFPAESSWADEGQTPPSPGKPFG